MTPESTRDEHFFPVFHILMCVGTRGLLKHARELREQQRAASGDLVHDLAEEERSAVLSEIDQIVAKNRIQAGPDTFRLSATRRGFGLPVLVNVAAIAVVAVGVWLTAQYFADRAEAVRSGADITVTAESRIIDEVRRRSEAALAERDAEIQSVQAELAAIQAEQRALAEQIDEQVAEREQELRTQVARDVAVERDRLQDEGFSSAEIERLITEYESGRIAELEAELEDYRQQLVQAQEVRSAELARLESASEAALESARRERVAILEEARQAEATLRAEFEEQLGRRRDEAEAAQARLSALAEQQEQRSFIENQIAGFFDRIRTEVARARYAEASALVGQLRSYLDRPDIRELPFMRERRASDLYILESLTRLIEPLAADRTAGEELSARLASLQSERDTLLETRESLEVQVATAQQALSDREAALEEALAIAAAAEADAQEARDAAAAAQTIAERADEARGIAETQRQDALAQRQEAMAQQQEAEQRAQEAETRAAAALAAAAEAQAVAAAAEAELADTRAALAVAEGRAGTVDERLAEAISRAEALETQRAQAVARAEAAEQQVSVLERSLETAEQKAEVAEARVAELSEALETASGDTVVAADPDMIAELERLREVEATVRQARNAYERFAESQAQVAGDADVLQAIDGKLRLDQFLRSQAVEAVFPGLASEVSRFDEAFEVSGRRAALGDMLEIVYSLSALQARQDRMNFLLEEQSRTDDPVVFEFLSELMDLVVN